MSNRSQAMEVFRQALKREFDISDNIAEASDHPYDCRCDKCLTWWTAMGPEEPEDTTYGPFTKEEIEVYKRENKL